MIGYEARQEAALSFRWRSYVLLAILGASALALGWRAANLALRDHGFLASQGNARFTRVAAIVAHRGTIIDRYGEPLAVSTPASSSISTKPCCFIESAMPTPSCPAM